MADNITKTEYQITGRYTNGKEVVGFHLQSIANGKSGKFPKEFVAYLIGKEVVTNCTAQIYKGKLLFRGKGISLDDLPTASFDEDLSTSAEELTIVGALKSGNRTVGGDGCEVWYHIGGGLSKYSRAKVIKLAQEGQITNARVQMYQGKPLLRGKDGLNLDTLPTEDVEALDD